MKRVYGLSAAEHTLFSAVKMPVSDSNMTMHIFLFISFGSESVFYADVRQQGIKKTGLVKIHGDVTELILVNVDSDARFERQG